MTVRKRTSLPAVGEVFIVRYPFIQEPREVMADFETGAMATIDSWNPGVRTTSGHNGYADWEEREADAMGEMVLTVVGAYKPAGRYQPRVFFTRTWRTPEGKEFGKPKMRIVTSGAFTSLTRGYKLPFEMAETETVSDSGPKTSSDIQQ